MKATRHFILCAVGLLMMTITSQAQDREPLVIGDFDTQGSASFGYRFTNVTGRQEKYLELFNLREGARLMDFSLFGRAGASASRFADRYSLTMNGMGGDPFPMAQFTVSKNKLYDLRVNFRQAYYQWNRDDSTPIPSSLTGTAANIYPAPPGPDHGLSNNHDWATVRKFGNVNFLLHATDNLRFGFEYQRDTRDGPTFVTRSMFYQGAEVWRTATTANWWGSYSRGMPYYVEAPVNEVSNRVTGSVEYTTHDWNFHYRLGYQTFEQNVTGNNLQPFVAGNSPQWPLASTGLNIDVTGTVAGVPNTPLAPNMPVTIDFQDSRRLKTPVSEFSYDGKVKEWLEIRGGYIFYRYSGPVARDSSYSGIGPTNSNMTTYAPFSVNETDRATVTEPNHVIDQGFSVRVRDWWKIHLDYRYQRLTEETDGVFYSVGNNADPTTICSSTSGQACVFTGTAENQWTIGAHTLNLSMEFVPVHSLIIRPGIRLLKSDITIVEDDEVDPDRTRRIKTAWPTLSVYYKPSKMFSVRGDVQSINNGTSYTRITPHTDVGSRIVFRFQPTDKLSIEDSLFVRNRRLASTDFKNDIRSNGINVSYAFTDRISAFGGFSYDTYLASGTASFIRGPVTPGTTTPACTAGTCVESVLDNYINRIWQGGLAARAKKYVGANVSGNFVRTTGLSQITGEPVISGPRTFPMITGTLWAEYPRIGRLSVDLQRTYYIEEIIRANNFQANVVMVRWTTDF